MHGPLSDLKIVEMAGLGPAPFACMLLADLGADIVTIERPGAENARYRVLGRGRKKLSLDLKSAAGVDAVLALVAQADCLVEGFRPGVMERLGLGPERLLTLNPRLVYGRMTGWGQEGPMAPMAGHDINYLSLTGALHAIGPAERPVPPLNLVADFGGGAMYLVMGLLAAARHAAKTGRGQVVDCAMVDGASSLMGMAWDMRNAGHWDDVREANMLDGGAPYYHVYETSDGGFMAVGAIEPQFFRLLIELTGLPLSYLPIQDDRAQWPRLKADLAKAFGSRTRAEWTAIFDGTDACVTPVLPMGEVASYPHMAARATISPAFNVPQPAPAPRFSGTPGSIRNAESVTIEAAIAAWTAGKT